MVVGITAVAGVVVGLLRRLTHLPARIPSLIEDLEHAHVDLRSAPGIVAVSAVSLIGGASLGPEQALGSMGGGAAGWVSRRRGLNDEDDKVNTLAGFAGAYGGLFSSTVIVVMLILEVARPGGQRRAGTRRANRLRAEGRKGGGLAEAGHVEGGAQTPRRTRRGRAA